MCLCQVSWLIEWTKGSSTCARCKRTGGTQLSAATKAKRRRDEEVTLQEKLAFLPPSPVAAKPFDNSPRPTVRPRPEDIPETLWQGVTILSNASTSTTRLVAPGDEVFRSFVVQHDDLLNKGYAKISLLEDRGDESGEWLATLFEVGQRVKVADKGRNGLFHSIGRHLVRTPLAVMQLHFPALTNGLLLQVHVDITDEDDPRLFDKENPRHVLQWLCGQGDSNFAKEANGLTEEVRRNVKKLASHARNSAECILELVGMSREVWAPVSMFLVVSDVGAPQGPPTIAGRAPGYHAIVNLTCCQKEVLVVRERDQVNPEDAMKFMNFEPHGSSNYRRMLYRRPDIEAFVYQVRRRIFVP